MTDKSARPRSGVYTRDSALVSAVDACVDDSNDIVYESVSTLAQLVRRRELSAVEIVEAHIARHLEANDMLNAIVMNCYARARAEAKALDAIAARGEFVGPLHGVPMTLKDSIDTEGVISTGGTYGRQQYIPKQDATVAKRLRRAGAILLGKTNTPEFTLGYLGGISTTCNLLYGSSHNPYDLSRSTSGSSGGAAAAVAAGLTPFDIGSDFGGSITAPAHVNGIAALKPTHVRVPRTGHIVDYGGMFDLWQQLGPMARRVEDLSLIMPVISGPDFRDAACAPVPWADPEKVDLAQLRVAFCRISGSPERNGETDQDTQRTVMQAAAWLKEIVAVVEENAPIEALLDLERMRGELFKADAWQFYRRMADRWGTKNYAPEYKTGMAELKPLSVAETVLLWEQHDRAKSRMLKWLGAYDVLIGPVKSRSAMPIDGMTPSGGAFFHGALNSAGWPATVVRCGTAADGNLPIGLLVAAPPWREDISLAVASYLEMKSGGWKRPPI